eukprot:g2668.t1
MLAKRRTSAALDDVPESEKKKPKTSIDNGTTISFNPNFLSTSYDTRVLEAPPAIVRALENGETLYLKGEADSEAVLCTDSETFSIRKVETSNTLLTMALSEGALKTRAANGQGEPQDRDELKLHSSFGFTLELQSFPGKIHQIASLLPDPLTSTTIRSIITNNSTIQQSSATHKSSTANIIANVQASKKEIQSGLLHLGAFQLNPESSWYTLASSLIQETLSTLLHILRIHRNEIFVQNDLVSWQALLRVMTSEGFMDATSVDDPGISPIALFHTLRIYSTDPATLMSSAVPRAQVAVNKAMEEGGSAQQQDANSADDPTFQLALEKIARFCGQRVFDIVKKVTIPFDEFMSAWKRQMPLPCKVVAKSVLLEDLMCTDEDEAEGSDDSNPKKKKENFTSSSGEKSKTTTDGISGTGETSSGSLTLTPNLLRGIALPLLKGFDRQKRVFTDVHLQSFVADQLPRKVTPYLQALWRRRRQWTIRDLKPYLKYIIDSDSELKGNSLNDVIKRYCRSALLRHPIKGDLSLRVYSQR